MTSTPSLLRTLLIYAICVPLALFLGYMIAQPDPLNTLSTYYAIGLVLAALAFPIVARWHRFLLVATWNTGVILFFLPARPELWLLFGWVSLTIAIVQYIITPRQKFLSAPEVTKPLVILLTVVFVTVAFRGGIGFAAFGSETYGGKKYLLILSSVIGYFAFITRRIRPRHVLIYAAAFFLGGATQFIGDLLPLLPPSLYFIYIMIPPTVGAVQSVLEDPSSSISEVEVQSLRDQAWDTAPAGRRAGWTRRGRKAWSCGRGMRKGLATPPLILMLKPMSPVNIAKSE